jgi:hypothetical protein
VFDFVLFWKEELHVISELSLARANLEGTSMINAIMVDEIHDSLIQLFLGYDLPSETRGEHPTGVVVGCLGTPLKHNYFICILIASEIHILLSITNRVRVVPRAHH